MARQNKDGGYLALLDYLFIMRPTLLVPVWTMVLLGYLFGRRGPVHHSILASLAAISLLVGGIYILNQRGDTVSDNANQKLFFIGQGLITPAVALFQAVIAIAVGVMWAFNISPAMGGCLAAALVIGILYNRFLQNHMWGGLLLNAVSFGTVAFSVGWIAASGFSLEMIIRSLPYWLAVGGIYLVTTIPDAPGDRQAGKKTFAVILGKKKTTIWATGLMGSGMITGFILRDPYLAVPCMFALPFFIISVNTKKQEDTVRGMKSALLTLALLLCRPFPVFLAVIVATYALARWYYRARFNLNYPYLFERIF